MKYKDLKVEKTINKCCECVYCHESQAGNFCHFDDYYVYIDINIEKDIFDECPLPDKK